VERHDLVKVRLAVGDAGQAEDGPGRVVGMAGHNYAAFLAGGKDGIQEILKVGSQIIGGNELIPLQSGLQLSQPLRLPTGQRKAVAVVNGIADQVHGRHGSQFLLIKIQAVGAVLRNEAGQIGAQPVKDRHKIVDNDLHSVFGQIADGGLVALDVGIPAGQPHLDVLVDVD